MELPPDPLPLLPARTLAAGTVLARIHRATSDPWTLASHVLGRFNLDPPRGTCYVAEDPVVAFLEVFGRHGAVIDRRSLSGFRLSLLRLNDDWRIADLTARNVKAAVVSTGPLPPELLRRAEDEFGVIVLPRMFRRR